MECAVCGRSQEEANLSEGIYQGEVVKVCEKCAEIEEIPLIKKPTSEQFIEADRHYNVRERMEKISNKREIPVSKEHEVALKNLGKLKIPLKKQQPKNLVDNYYWEIKMARRRKKFSIAQLSNQIGIPVEVLEAIEKAQLPKNYESTMRILEEILEIKVFKEPNKKLIFHFPEKSKEKKQKEILKNVGEKIKEDKIKKQDAVRDIASGKFDFSRRENLKNVTISDLVDLKKKKEEKEMFGDEIELEGDN